MALRPGDQQRRHTLTHQKFAYFQLMTNISHINVLRKIPIFITIFMGFRVGFAYINQKFPFARYAIKMNMFLKHFFVCQVSN